MAARNTGRHFGQKVAAEDTGRQPATLRHRVVAAENLCENGLSPEGGKAIAKAIEVNAVTAKLAANTCAPSTPILLSERLRLSQYRIGTPSMFKASAVLRASLLLRVRLARELCRVCVSGCAFFPQCYCYVDQPLSENHTVTDSRTTDSGVLACCMNHMLMNV